jgi:hypothetical protein
MWSITSSPVAVMSAMTSRRVDGAVGADHKPSVGILAHVVDDVLRCWSVARRWRRTSPDVSRIGYRRVKVRWMTPLGDETASTS